MGCRLRKGSRSFFPNFGFVTDFVSASITSVRIWKSSSVLRLVLRHAGGFRKELLGTGCNLFGVGGVGRKRTRWGGVWRLFVFRQDRGGVIGGGLGLAIGVGGRSRGLASILDGATVDDVGSVDKVSKVSGPSSSFICLLVASLEAAGRCGLGTGVISVSFLRLLLPATQPGHCQPCHVTSVSRKHCLIHSTSSFFTSGGRTP